MEFDLLNKSRHAVKNFDGKKIPIDTIKEIIMDATLAPSGINSQTWHFVIVETSERLNNLLVEVKPANHAQIKEAGALIVLFSDTDMIKRTKEIADLGKDSLSQEVYEKFTMRYPKMIANFSDSYLNSYLSINTGLVTMNLMYAIYNRGYVGNILLGFNRTKKINEILGIDQRFRPELIIPFGTSEDKGYSSYRLPQENVIEVR